MKHGFLKILLLITPFLCVSQSLTLNIVENHFKIDETNFLVLSHIDDMENYVETNGFNEVVIFLN